MRLNDDKKIKTIDKDQASSYLEIKEIFNDNELVKQIPGPQQVARATSKMNMIKNR